MKNLGYGNFRDFRHAHLARVEAQEQEEPSAARSILRGPMRISKHQPDWCSRQDNFPGQWKRYRLTQYRPHNIVR
jgi:hypothetical protein